MENQKKDRQRIPINELDFNMLTTNSVWGKSEIPVELRNLLSEYRTVTVDGQDKFIEISSWGLLGFLTRDLRLANLSKEEMVYCQYMLDLANDFLELGCKKAFLTAIERVASVTELSQSKNGFLRELMNTLKTESKQELTENKPKSLFGLGKKKGG